MTTWFNAEAGVRISIERKGQYIELDVSAVGSTMHIHSSLQMSKWGAKYIPMAATFVPNEAARKELKKLAEELARLVKDIESGK